MTVSCFERVQNGTHLRWDLNEVNTRREKIMRAAFIEVLEMHLERKVSMRNAATVLAIQRVASATELRGLYP